MATFYVRSGATGAGTGADWVNAFTTLAAALAAMAAGDTAWLSDDHAESSATTLTLTSPGNAGSPCRVLCANAHTSTPPTGLGTTATVATSGTAMTLAGFAYCYGVSFSSAGNGTAALTFGVAGAGLGWTLESCALALAGTSTTSRISIGTTSASGIRDAWVDLNNTTVSFGNVSQAILVDTARFRWRNTPNAVQGATVPNVNLFLGTVASSSTCEISGVDLSALGSTPLVRVDVAGTGIMRFYFRNCKLGTNAVVTTGTVIGPGSCEVYLDDCDSSGTNYRMEHYKFQGSVKQETTKVRSGGASDGTTGISWNITSLATGPAQFQPLESVPCTVWNDTAGASKTVTVEFLHDSLTALTNADIWMRVEYLGSAASPQASFASSGLANVLSTPVTYASSVATWTTTGVTNPNKQKMSVTFTPQMKGPFRVIFLLAKPSYTVYIDPLLTIS